MKNCSEIRENISVYIDSELSIEDRLAFEEHLASCPDCRQECDEIMQIVGLCKDMQEVELPDNFRDELHRKLIDAAGKSNVKSNILQRSKYIKIISSIAAGFVLIFLFSSVFKLGFSPNMKSTGSANIAPVQAEQKSAAAAKEETVGETFGAATASVADSNPDIQFSESTSSYTTKQSSDTVPATGRSATDAGRTVQSPALAFAKAAEAVNSSVATLTVLVDDPAVQAEDIKSIAVHNGGGEQPAADFKTKAMDMTDTTNAGNDIVLTFSIPNEQYNSFTKALNTGYGQSNVEPGALESEDKTSVLYSLITQSNNIDTEIKKLEEADSVANADKINGLQTELQTVQNDIENLRLNTGFTIVTVTVKKK